MKTLSPTQSFTDLEMGKNTGGLIVDNLYDEIGRAGIKNTDLRPDIIRATTRFVSSITSSSNALPSATRIAIIPRECEEIVKDTIIFLSKLGIPGMLPLNNIMDVNASGGKTLIEGISSSMSSAAASQIFHDDSQPFIPHNVPNIVYPTICTQPLERDLNKMNIGIHGKAYVADLFNNKAFSADICKQSGIFTPDCENAFTEEGAKKAYKLLKHRVQGPILIKGGRCAGGFGLLLIENDDQFEQSLEDFSPYFEPKQSSLAHDYERNAHFAHGVVLQEYVDKIASPSAVVHIGNKFEQNHVLLGITEQILENDHNIGNRYPLGTYATPTFMRLLEREIEKCANLIAEKGGEGMTVGMDFMAVQDTQSGNVYPMLAEFNIRKTAPYAGLAMTHKILGTTNPKDAAYFIGSIPGKIPLPEKYRVAAYEKHLGFRGQFYNHERSGIIPLNLSMSDEVSAVIIANSKTKVDKLLERAPYGS